MKPGNPGHMDEYGQRIAWLVAGYIRHTLTESEHDELDAWINESDDNMKLFEEWTDDDNIQANLEWMDKVNAEKSFHELQARGAFHSSKRAWIWAVAACTLLIIVAILVFRSTKTSLKNQQLAVKDSILPGGNKATLEFGNGQLIDLDNIGVGKLENGAEKIVDGQLSYSHHADNTVAETNILRTPVGGQYQVQLSDGTKVWLNASSKLSYPASFKDSIRIVQLTGEAYFEVAKDLTKPFLVALSNNSSVRVLGTHFNINSYTNEASTEVSLLEGSVAVKHDQQQLQLNPGEQAQLRLTGIKKIDRVDMHEVVGWKDGYFIFHDAGIESIMRQLERWYGIHTVYKGKPADLFNATIYRSESIEKLLSVLERTGRVHFNIINKTIYVLP